MAGAWPWILVYFVGFCLFQVLLYRYLQRNETSFEQAAPDFGDGEGSTAAGVSAGVAGHDHDAVQCQHCGTYNERDQMFSYCRACARRIDGST